jgi:hypothetical protein
MASTLDPESAMPDVSTLLDKHVVLKYECLDRLLLNGYLPRLQTPEQLAGFLCRHRGEEIPRYDLLGELTSNFMTAVDQLALDHDIPVVHFERGQRKEDIAAPYFAAAQREGVVLIGIAQEKANVFRPCGRRQREKGKYSVTRAAAYVNHVYFYIWDADWGPSFIKVCTYAPWSIRVWLNGHEWVKRQLERRGIGFTPLDNGIAAVDDPRLLQRTCDRLSSAHVQRYFDRWLYRLPSPLAAKDRHAGYVHALSILQLEISRTEVFDRPLHGRQFFEAVIREHLDLGRPEKLQLLFHRRLPRRRGEGPFRTRVFSADVDPSLHVSHRHTRIKQYFKCDRALRTETTINDAGDFRVGKLLRNLDALRQIGRDINLRLLDLERQTQQCTPAATTFEGLVLPTGEPGHRAPGLRFGDPRVVALFGALCDFRWIRAGIRSRELRPLVEHHLARPYTPGQMAYDLRRLVRKGLLERLPKSHRYVLTQLGRQLVLFCSRLYGHILVPGISQLEASRSTSPLALAWRRFDREAAIFVSNMALAA